MITMTRRQILPAIEKYATALSADVLTKHAVSPVMTCGYETKTAARLAELADAASERVDELEKAADNARAIEEIGPQSFAIRDSVLDRMNALRALCDEAETITAAEYWPFPTYGDLLFSVN
jgi:glutamine synthetase